MSALAFVEVALEVAVEFEVDAEFGIRLSLEPMMRQGLGPEIWLGFVNIALGNSLNYQRVLPVVPKQREATN